MNKKKIAMALLVFVLVFSFFFEGLSLPGKKEVLKLDDKVIVQRDEDLGQGKTAAVDRAMEEKETKEEKNLAPDKEEGPGEDLEESSKKEPLYKEADKALDKVKDKEETKGEKKEALVEKKKDREAAPKKDKKKEELVLAEAAEIREESTVKTPEKKKVHLVVSAKTLVNQKGRLAENKRGLVPANGIIYSKKNVEIKDGDSVFDVLSREMRSSNIQMSARFTPVYKTSYVEAINNIYEFDAGDLSGWMYRVNGEFLGQGASETLVKDGDLISWEFTCNLGKDLGGRRKEVDR